MRQRPPRSLSADIATVCFELLAAAVALYVAVRLIEAIWPALLIIIGIACSVVVLRALWRTRRGRW